MDTQLGGVGLILQAGVLISTGAALLGQWVQIQSALPPPTEPWDHRIGSCLALRKGNSIPALRVDVEFVKDVSTACLRFQMLPLRPSD